MDIYIYTYGRAKWETAAEEERRQLGKLIGAQYTVRPSCLRSSPRFSPCSGVSRLVLRNYFCYCSLLFCLFRFIFLESEKLCSSTEPWFV